MSSDASWVGLERKLSDRVPHGKRSGSPVFELHQVEDVCAATNEEDLHDGVV